jgi:hypothetical protein
MRDSSVSFSKGLYVRLEPEIMVSAELIPNGTNRSSKSAKTTSRLSTPSPQGGTPPIPQGETRGELGRYGRDGRYKSDKSWNYVDARGKVMMFWEPESECYGFVVSPKLSKETQLADVQYNTKYGTVGFESLVPTVARVLYDYGIDADRVKLSVTEQMCGEMKWYRIERGR